MQTRLALAGENLGLLVHLPSRRHVLLTCMHCCVSLYICQLTVGCTTCLFLLTWCVIIHSSTDCWLYFVSLSFDLVRVNVLPGDFFENLKGNGNDDVTSGIWYPIVERIVVAKTNLADVLRQLFELSTYVCTPSAVLFKVTTGVVSTCIVLWQRIYIRSTF